MADSKSSDCHPVTFACVDKDKVYFQVDDDGLESDTFMKEKEPVKKFIYDMEKRCLILEEKCLKFVRDGGDCIGCPFDIQMYNNNAKDSPHLAVILSVNYMEKKHIVCCSGTSVVPEVEPLPGVISDTKHKAVFYLIRDPKGYKLESSVKRKHYLGLERMSGSDGSCLALVDCEGQEGQDEPDERVILDLHLTRKT